MTTLGKMRYLVAIIALAFVALPATAQLTTVSGTVKDVNGIPYANALMKAQLVTTTGSAVTGQPTVTVNNQAQCVSAGLGSAPCQMPFQGTVGQFQISSAGSFTVNLQDNTQVTPAATQWLFTFNTTGTPPPIGTGAQVCTGQLTISGANQTVSTSFSACPSLSNIAGGSGTPGSIVNFGPSTIIVNTAGNGVTTPMVPGTQLYGCTITSGQNTVTCPNFVFTSAMIGNLIDATNGCCGGTAPLAAVYSFPLNAGAENTITGCSPSCPSSVATVTQNATSTVTAAASIVTFGPDSTAAATAITNLLNSTTSPFANATCPPVVFGGGIYMVKVGEFNVSGNGCKNPIQGGTPVGDTQASFSGFGPVGVAIHPTQDFNFATCGGGFTSTACFFSGKGVRLYNIGINGGGAGLSTNASTFQVVETDNDGSLNNFICAGWAGAAVNSVGLSVQTGAQPSGFMQFDSCGALPLNVVATGGQWMFNDSFFSDSGGASAFATQAGTTVGSTNNSMGNCTVNGPQWNIGGAVISSGDIMSNCVVNTIGVSCPTGCLLKAFGLNANVGGTAASGNSVTGSGDFRCTGCNLQSVGNGVAVSNTSRFLSGGGNTISTPLINATTATMILEKTDVLTGSITGIAPTCSVTGAGGAATCAVFAGGANESGLIVVTAAAGATAAISVTITFAGKYGILQPPAMTGTLNQNAVICTGAYNARATVIEGTISIGGPSTAVFNIDNNAVALTAGSTYCFEYITSTR